MLRVMIALGIVGHAINMYCDRILSIFPNGTIKFDNIKEIEKDGVLAEMMEDVPASVPLRSAVLGAFALVLEFFSYFALAVYTFERSQILGGVMFVAITFSCILGGGLSCQVWFCRVCFSAAGTGSHGKGHDAGSFKLCAHSADLRCGGVRLYCDADHCHCHRDHRIPPLGITFYHCAPYSAAVSV